MDIIWAVIGGVIAVGLLFAGILPRIRTERAKGVIDLQAAEIEAYRGAIAAQDQRYDEKLRQSDARYQREIGELRGRVDAMTPEFARTLAGFLAPLLREEV